MPAKREVIKISSPIVNNSNHHSTGVDNTLITSSPSSTNTASSSPSNNNSNNKYDPPLSRDQLINKINVTQTQLYLVFKEKQNLQFQNKLLEEENKKLKKMVNTSIKTQVQQIERSSSSPSLFSNTNNNSNNNSNNSSPRNSANNKVFQSMENKVNTLLQKFEKANEVYLEKNKFIKELTETQQKIKRTSGIYTSTSSTTTTSEDVSSEDEDDEDSSNTLSSSTNGSTRSSHIPTIPIPNNDDERNSVAGTALDVDSAIVSARERKKRLPSVFHHHRTEGNAGSKLNIISSHSVNSTNRTTGSASIFYGAKKNTESSSPSSNRTSVESNNVIVNNNPIKEIKQKVDKTTNGKLIIEYPVNPIFSKSSIQKSSAGGGAGGGFRARVSLIQTTDIFSEPVQSFIISNNSKLLCEGNNNDHYVKTLLDSLESTNNNTNGGSSNKTDVLNNCKEYLEDKENHELKKGEVFCGSITLPESDSGQREIQLIHLFVDNSLPSIEGGSGDSSNNENEGSTLDLNQLAKTSFFTVINNAVRNALECADLLEVGSIAICPLLYRNKDNEIIPQYGVKKNQWISAARCMFRSTFDHCIENRLSSNLIDIRFLVTSDEESKLLKQYFDTDYAFFIFNFAKNQHMSVNLVQSPLEFSPKPTEEKQLKDPKDYYDTDYTQLESVVEEDSPSNIEWMESTTEDSEPEIKCATVEKLIERVTYHKNYDNAYLYAFLLTYRSFISPHELMDKLINRYNLPPPNPKGISKLDFSSWQEEVLQQVRLRITQLVKYWLENHYYDFENDNELVEKVKKLSSIMERTQGKHFSTQILNSLKRQQSLDVARNEIAFVKIEKPIEYPKKYKIGKDDLLKFDILSWPSAEIARQMTLIEYSMFKSIRPKECLNQSWNKESREKKAFNIFQMINWFNKVSRWVATEVLKEPDLKKRIDIITKMIQIAKECRELNNFNAIFEIISGLQNSAVHRLKKTWEGLKTKYKNRYDELYQLISGDNNFRAIRHAILYVKPPCIPYIGVFLTDLTFIEDGNKDVLNDKINFIKRRKLAMLIRDIQTYQQTPYYFHTVPELQEKLKEIRHSTDQELYKISLEFEPRQK
ncbi:hypothetical protein ABK040_001333 [Willaertia magna]